MAKKQSRRGVSINRALYEATKQHCAERDVPVAQLVERLLYAELGLEQPTKAERGDARVAASLEAKFPGDPCNKAIIEQRVMQRRALAATAAAPIGAGLSAKVELPVSEGTLSLLDDECTRRWELDGKSTTPGEVMDEAINRTLDHLERSGAPALPLDGAR